MKKTKCQYNKCRKGYFFQKEKKKQKKSKKNEKNAFWVLTIRLFRGMINVVKFIFS